MIIQGNDPTHQPSFSLANRIKRQLWNIVYLCLFRFSPRPFHQWRAFILKLFGAHLGYDCHVYPGVKIWAPWNLYLGNSIGIADGVNLYSMDKIHIGDYAVISQGVYLCCGSHDYNSKNFQLFTKPIKVEKRAWLCAEVFVHPGVIIPEGAVVGACSVVNKTLPESWAVYAGNPCRQVALRTKLSD